MNRLLKTSVVLLLLAATGCFDGGGGGGYVDDTVDDVYCDSVVWDCDNDDDYYDPDPWPSDPWPDDPDPWPGDPEPWPDDPAPEDPGDDPWDPYIVKPSGGFALKNAGQTRGRDLVSKIGSKREQDFRKSGAKLAAQYGLSAEVGVRIVRTLGQYRRLSSKRERTKADLEKLTRNIFGVNLNEVVSALTSNDKKHMNDLIEDAAEHLQTSPENMKEIVKKFYKDESL